MFSDLSGYTALNERMDPEEVSVLMTQVIAMATRVVQAHGGVVNQVVGDEVLALFGIPQAGRDDPLRAVRAALALRREMNELAATVAARGGPRLALHTGIHTGLILVRPSESHQGRFGLTGDTVNTAARLLTLAAADEIVIGQATLAAVMPHVDTEPMPATPVRGKAAPLAAWRVLRESPPAALPVMVGRDEAWGQALSALGACVTREEAQILVIRGEAGIGKSRLLGALVEEAVQRGFPVASAQLPDFGPSRGDVALRQLTLALLGSSSPEAAAGALERAVESGHLAPLLAPHLSALAGLPFQAGTREALAQLDVSARERGAVDALAAVIRWRVASAGVLVCIEDSHWAAAPALALVARLAAACRRHPVLLAVTTRPESAELEKALRTHARNIAAVTIDLAPLSDSAAWAMAARFRQGAPEVVARCVERSGGNPLFLEQLLMAAGDALSDDLPGSVQAIVLSRMDRLAPEDRVALQTASVLGQRLEVEALRAVLERPAYALASLVEAGLLRENGGAIEFAHALIRDGAYESLLKSLRRKLHLRAAQWFSGRDPGLHAEHLEQAGSTEAARAYLQACEFERDRFRFDAALAMAQRGSRLETESATRFALGMRAGEALRELGRNKESVEAFELARSLATSDEELLEVRVEAAGAQRNVSDHAGALASLAAAQPLAEGSGDLRRRTQIHYLRGNIAFSMGQHELCAAEHSRALELAEQSGDLLGQAQALSGLGDSAYLLGHMRSAVGHFRRCLALAAQVGARRFSVMNRAMVGWCLYFCGEPDQALLEQHAAVAEAQALGHRNAMVMTGQSLGFVLRWMGRWAEAAEVNARALALAREVGARRFESIIAVAVAAQLRIEGRRDQARAVAEDAWKIANDAGAATFIGPMALLEMAHSASDAPERERLYAQAERMLADKVISHCHVWLRADMIAHRLDQGRYDEALRQASLLEQHVAAEPLAWAMLPVAAAPALVRSLRDGDRSPGLRAELDRLVGESIAIAHGEYTVRLERALALF